MKLVFESVLKNIANESPQNVDLLREYFEVRAARQRAAEREIKNKAEILRLMKKHRLTKYAHGGFTASRDLD